MDCIFCKIVKGEIDSAKIYENEDTLAFLDLNPISKGHCLVIPKKHFQDIFDIDEDALKKIIDLAKTISENLKKYLKADGISLLQVSGKAAGQIIFHFHLHVVPRHEGDGLNFYPVPRQKSSLEELKQLAEEISSNSPF